VPASEAAIFPRLVRGDILPCGVMTRERTTGDGMRTLDPWEMYTRKEVHDIFSPDTVFRPQGGSWGISGIVGIPNRTADTVFFVTFGSRQGAHNFDESITTDGVLTWQSQPSQRLSDPQIRQFIEHDDRLHTIHLFLRSRRGRPYTYCGTLGYLSHDLDREAPVYFQWQLMELATAHRDSRDAGNRDKPIDREPLSANRRTNRSAIENGEACRVATRWPQHGPIRSEEAGGSPRSGCSQLHSRACRRATRTEA
jgi:hypothetical protein